MFWLRAAPFALAAVTFVNSQVTIKDTAPCILNCIVTGASEGGCPVDLSISSYKCFCASKQSHNTTSACLKKFCEANEIQLASTLETQMCAAAAADLASNATGSNSTSAAFMLRDSGVLPALGAFAFGLLLV